MFLKSLLGFSVTLADAYTDCSNIPFEECGGNGCTVYDDACVDTAYYCAMDGCDGRDDCIPYGSECIDNPFPTYDNGFLRCHYTSLEDCSSNGCTVYDNTCVDSAYYCAMDGCDGRDDCIPYGSECIDDPLPYMLLQNSNRDCHFLAEPCSSDDMCAEHDNGCIGVDHYCAWNSCELAVSVEQQDYRSKDKNLDHVDSYVITIEYKEDSVVGHALINDSISCSVTNNDAGSDYGISSNGDFTVLAQAFQKKGTNRIGSWVLGEGDSVKLQPKRKKSSKWEYTLRGYGTDPDFRDNIPKYWLSYFYSKDSSIESEIIKQTSNYSSRAYINCEGYYGDKATVTIKTSVSDEFDYDFDVHVDY